MRMSACRMSALALVLLAAGCGTRSGPAEPEVPAEIDARSGQVTIHVKGST
jgi:hypothetical protein